MSQLTKAFTVADATRREIRNAKRAAFFSDLGLEILADPFVLNVGPEAQRAVVLKLLRDSLETHKDERSAIRQALGELETLQLGTGAHTDTGQDRPTPTHMYPGAWAEAFFNVR